MSMLGGPDRRDDRVDRLLELVSVGDDVDGFGRRPERGDVALAVELIASPELGQDVAGVDPLAAYLLELCA